MEFNRGQPFELDADGVAFPLSPTVHGSDARTILENASVVSDMVATARRVTGKSRVSISPLSLSPSGNPLTLRPGVVAAWLTQVIARAAGADVASITLASDLL